MRRKQPSKSQKSVARASNRKGLGGPQKPRRTLKRNLAQGALSAQDSHVGLGEQRLGEPRRAAKRRTISADIKLARVLATLRRIEAQLHKVEAMLAQLVASAYERS